MLEKKKRTFLTEQPIVQILVKWTLWLPVIATDDALVARLVALLKVVIVRVADLEAELVVEARVRAARLVLSLQTQ